MNTMKRLLAMVLVLCLVLGAVPFYAFAEEQTEEEALASLKGGMSTMEEQAVQAIQALTAAEKSLTITEKPADGTTTGNPFIQDKTGGSNCFRIPALVTLSNGTLVAAADARWNSNYDGGGLDTVVSRSTNNGTTWNYTFANYLGDNGNTYSGLSSCFIDPALAVSGNTVYMLVDLYPHGIALNGSGNTQPSTAVGFYDDYRLKLTKDGGAYYLDLTNNTIYPEAGGAAVSGYSVDPYFNITGNDGTNTNLFFADSPFQVVRTGYLYLTKSVDGGATWSVPKLLNVKNRSEMVCLVGPGRGLVTKSGTIVFPVYSYNGSSESQKTSFVYSEDNGATWKRTDSINHNSIWSSEAAVVELDSNTLRFFFRNGTARLYYADYSLNNGKVEGGSWGSPVSTGIVTNSNTQISAITYSKTIDGKQVILVSCPAGPNNNGSSNSGASYRVNGKIFAFTVENNKTLSLKGTISITSKNNNSTNYFLYSCLTELNNGNVGILFEDNVSGNDYCEMSFEVHDIAQEMNLIFDVPSTESANRLVDEPQAVAVGFGDTDVAGWTMLVTPTTATVPGAAEYCAYDITIKKSDGTYYTEAAEVTLPLVKLTNTQGVYPFVLTDGQVEKINSSRIENGYITFTAPHFSVVGLAVDEQEVTEEDEVTGGTGSGATPATYKLDNDGFDDGATYVIVCDNKAFTYDGSNFTSTTVQESGDTLIVAEGVDMSGALWTRTKNSLLSAKYGQHLIIRSNLGLQDAPGNQINSERDYWSGKFKITQYNGSTYNLRVNGTSWVGTYRSGQASLINLYIYTPGTSGDDVYSVTPAKQEALINAYTVDPALYASDANLAIYQNALTTAKRTLETVQNGEYATEAEATAALNNLIAKVAELKTAKDNLTRMISITVEYRLENGQLVQSEIFSVAENATSLRLKKVIVGTDGKDYKLKDNQLTLNGAVNYDVTVEAGAIVDVLLVVGDSMTHTIEDIVYTDSDISQPPNATITNMSIENAAGKGMETVTSATAFAEGKKFLIISKRSSTNGLLTSQPYTATISWSGLQITGLKTNGTVAVDSTDVWSVIPTGTDGAYYVKYGDKYLTLDYNPGSTAALVTDPVQLYLSYDNNGYWFIRNASGDYLSNVGGFVNQYYGASGFTDGDDGSRWEIREITTVNANTQMTFTGESVGRTTAKVGLYDYNITVRNVPQNVTVENSPFVVGQNQTGVELDNPVVTKLTTSVGTTYDVDLGITGTDIRWSTLDPSVATVDENGRVTGTGTGETTLLCYVDNNVYALPISVINNPGTGNRKLCSIYVEDIISTDVYYSWSLSGDKEQFTKTQIGEMIRVEYPADEAYGVSFYGAPHKGYALTFMNATNSAGQYLSLQDKKDPTKCDYYTKDGAGRNQANEVRDFTALKNDIKAATELGCDGAQGFTRGAGSTGEVDTELVFISEKLVEVDKIVEGVLATSKLQADYRHYYAGMVAGTGELIYYKITVTLERPKVWKEGSTTEAALVYDNAKLVENMDGAYFYTKDLDMQDPGGKWDGEITTDANRSNTQDITDALNAPWGADEDVRVLTYYVIYKITADDIPKFQLENDLRFSYDYNSLFSSAAEIQAHADALAYITVVTSPLEDVVIDTPQPITITGLTNDHLKFAFGDGDTEHEGYKAPEAKYGTVSVTKVPRTEKDENGNVKLDGNGNPIYLTDGCLPTPHILYDFTITYTPDPSKGVLTEPDSIVIYGWVPDENDLDANGNPIEKAKVVNGFNIFPATTVYYEENYVDKWDDGWKAEGSALLPTQDTENDAWYVDYVGDYVGETTEANKLHNYGYDPVYEGSNQASNGTYVTTATLGVVGEFDFTGSGFEIYANCTPDTGYVAVLVTSNSGAGTWLYTVNTAVDTGDTDATNKQENEFWSVPIVSEQDLEHGSYTVKIIKTVDMEPKKDENGNVVKDENGNVVYVSTAPKPVNIDGIRIFHTMNPATSGHYFITDGEDGPSFVELRDLVLTGASVQNVSGSEYEVAQNIVSQVYSDTGTLATAVVVSNAPGFVTDVKDLLENGPKNELYLWPGQAVTFTLQDGITAQIGMKTVSGTPVEYEYVNNGDTENPATHTLNSSVDMFYHDDSTGAVTITNKSGGVLSITLLKYFGTPVSGASLLSELGQDQLVYAVKSVGYFEAPAERMATLKVNYVTQAGHRSLSFGDRVIALPDRKIETVTLTKVMSGDETQAVFTAADIREALPDGVVIRNLQDITVDYGQTATRTYFASPASQADAYVIERAY